jgi:hypothetical protein
VVGFKVSIPFVDPKKKKKKKKNNKKKKKEPEKGR